MKLAHLSAPITRPETLWQWLCLLTLVCLGWISREQLGVMFAEIETETDNGALLVYDHDGNGHVFLPDDVAGRQHSCLTPATALPPRWVGAQGCETLLELDVALMKPSCCDAPEGLSHLWYLPKRIGAVLPFRRLRPALTHHPDLSITSSRTSAALIRDLLAAFPMSATRSRIAFARLPG